MHARLKVLKQEQLEAVKPLLKYSVIKVLPVRISKVLTFKPTNRVFGMFFFTLCSLKITFPLCVINQSVLKVFGIPQYTDIAFSPV